MNSRRSDRVPNPRPKAKAPHDKATKGHKTGKPPGPRFRFWVTTSLSPSENLVRGWCQVRGGKNGVCKDSLRSIAQNLHLDWRTVREALANLVEKGYLEPVSEGGGWKVSRRRIEGWTVSIPDGLMRAPIPPRWKIVLGRRRDAREQKGWALGSKALARQLGYPRSTVRKALAWQKNQSQNPSVGERTPRSTRPAKGVGERTPRSTEPPEKEKVASGVGERTPPRRPEGPPSVGEGAPRSTLRKTSEKQTEKADPKSMAWRRSLPEDPIEATRAILSACGFDPSQKKTLQDLASQWVQAGRSPGQALTLGLKALDQGKNPGALLRSLMKDTLQHPEEKIPSTTCGKELRDQEAFEKRERLRQEEDKASWFDLSIPKFRAYDRARKIRERLRGGAYTPEEVAQDFGLSSPKEALELAAWADQVDEDKARKAKEVLTNASLPDFLERPKPELQQQESPLPTIPEVKTSDAPALARTFRPLVSMDLNGWERSLQEWGKRLGWDLRDVERKKILQSIQNTDWESQPDWEFTDMEPLEMEPLEFVGF